MGGACERQRAGKPVKGILRASASHLFAIFLLPALERFLKCLGRAKRAVNRVSKRGWRRHGKHGSTAPSEARGCARGLFV